MINLDSQDAPLYTFDVSKNRDEKKAGYVTIRLSAEFKEALETIALRERRTVSQVGLFLVERGFGAYTRDGLLQEPGGLALTMVKDNRTSAFISERKADYGEHKRKPKR